jgi:transcriptional regulator with XRE-family HTH domain
MKRTELLKSPEWWLAEIQHDLHALIHEYMNKNNLKKKDLAEKLQVTKGYVSQILNGNFDHKLSKLIELSLAMGKVPKIVYVDLKEVLPEKKGGSEAVPIKRARSKTKKTGLIQANR